LLELKDKRRPVPHIDFAQPTPLPQAQDGVMLNRSQQQRATHVDALRRFARRKEISEEVLVATYEIERQRLTAGARVERVVDILAEKRVKRALTARKR
jgi:hypothetical protein